MVNALCPDESPGMERTQEFGHMLRRLREQRNLTQEDLAELIDRSVQAISKMERGHSLPNLETLIRISEKLNVPLHELIKVFDPTKPVDPARAPLEASIIDSSRRLSMRDLHIVAQLVKAFPVER